ncbi:prepilin-type N-terminal cleavage/methylation domain-containing protein [Seongchinamella sediminis]|uniref:Prepilin-type N-terminal cleavage/methylation domain-containing protein n=1 Tax=Seongchinamella sediminis TaxID=2283635 RepID=A0A3L7DZK6_9GAMM|nr:type IV pilin protein [Seongchinamella sediminis]RLQ21421.1 prepilin-type N-terminal cleavage/methylation domain-containing protein [Seongchinamella sediminis]
MKVSKGGVVGTAIMKPMPRVAGFSLIEMMIVLVVAGILFYVALPAYQNSVLKSNRNIARGTLMDVASREEQHFINNKAYTDALTALGLPANYYLDRNGDQSIAGDAIYIVTLSTVGGGYSITAAPQNKQVKDTRCGSLTLNNLGVKGETGTLDPEDCW